MHKLLAAAAITALALGASVVLAPKSEAASCAMIRGTGIGATDGIARWMASKAVTDSAAKWAAGGKHTLTPIKLTCGGFSCDGAAKACKK